MCFVSTWGSVGLNKLFYIPMMKNYATIKAKNKQKQYEDARSWYGENFRIYLEEKYGTEQYI